jgi:alanine racemase
MTHLRPTESATGGRVTVDLSALVSNWRAVGRAAPGAEVAGVVKADAYGTGLTAVAGALAAAGCRTFFVALPSEGADLRRVVPDAAIYVLNGYIPGAGALYGRHHLAPVLGDRSEIDAWLADGRPGAAPAIHVDTGLNRLGLDIGTARDLAADAVRLAALAPSLLVGHFACADEPGHPMNVIQTERFAAVRAAFPGLRASLANSAGIGLGPSVHHDLVRPGIALYGGNAGPRAPAGLRPVVTVEARVLTVRAVRAGETVGYGASATARRDSRVAVVACGYADGYPRRLAAAGAHAAIGGRRAPLIGRVSMDLAAIDVTDLPADAVRRGDFVELIGPSVPLWEIAEAAGTIDYEILTGLGRRFERLHRA